MPVQQSPAQNAGERRAEDARVRADDALPGVLGSSPALRPPQPQGERQQRLLQLPGQAQKGQLSPEHWQPAIANHFCCLQCQTPNVV